MIADSNNFFFECDRSNSNAKIPHATVGRAAPATNRRRQSFTASLTCATRAGSSLLIAAVINTTHKTRPKAFNNIRALINRCPTGEPLHHSRLAFAAQPTMCGPAGEIPHDPDFALGVSLKLEELRTTQRDASVGLPQPPAGLLLRPPAGTFPVGQRAARSLPERWPANPLLVLSIWPFKAIDAR